MASELEKAVAKLIQKEPGWKEFMPKPGAPQPDSAGKAVNAVPKAGASGSGLTEQNYAARTYHARKTLRSTDSLITWLYDPIKTITMVDSAGATVVLTFAEPTT